MREKMMGVKMWIWGRLTSHHYEDIWEHYLLLDYDTQIK